MTRKADFQWVSRTHYSLCKLLQQNIWFLGLKMHRKPNIFMFPYLFLGFSFIMHPFKLLFSLTWLSNLVNSTRKSWIFLKNSNRYVKGSKQLAQSSITLRKTLLQKTITVEFFAFAISGNEIQFRRQSGILAKHKVVTVENQEVDSS